MKRFIGGVAFVIIFIIALYSKFINIFFLGCAIVGTFEVIKMMYKKKSKLYIGYIYIVIFLLGINSLSYLTELNASKTLYLCITIMFADTCAYFVGKNFGRNKLSAISPKKTIEGLIGGIVGGLLLSNVLMYFLKSLNLKKLFFIDVQSIQEFYFSENFTINIIMCIIVIILSVFGDLLESFVKRSYEVKDSGKIIYGHGGILDRMDSWILSSIFIFISFKLMGV